MPGLNHTGPEGHGPRTGRALGRCRRPQQKAGEFGTFELGKGMGKKRQTGGGTGLSERKKTEFRILKP